MAVVQAAAPSTCGSTIFAKSGHAKTSSDADGTIVAVKTTGSSIAPLRTGETRIRPFP